MSTLMLIIAIVIAILLSQALITGTIYVFRKQLIKAYIKFTVNIVKNMEQELKDSFEE